MMRHGCGFGFGMGGGFLWTILLLIAVVGLGVFFISKISSSKGSRDSNKNLESSALDILQERYAKGEISDEEYEQKKKILKEK